MTEEVVMDGFQFYATFFNAPPAIKVQENQRILTVVDLCVPVTQALLHGMIGIGLIGTLSKLHKWDESAVFFDGPSLGTIPWHVTLNRVLCTHVMSMLASFILIDSCLCLQHCALRNGYNPITTNSRDSTPGGNKTKPSTSFVRPLRRKCDHHSLPAGRVGTSGTTYCRFLSVINLFGFPPFLRLSPGRAGVCTSTRRPSVCQDGEGHRSRS